MVIYEVYNAFEENTRYTITEINQKLKRIFKVFGIPFDGRGCASLIRLYFECEKDDQGRNRGWMLFTREF